ncbi:RluA family pseudouridine synthase [Colwellia psychrerythraea]|uniref:RNA pseudouridine synthase family protein n=1 Tax=Colwellia psychrerythraea (strain 34H / ATCC BAA-681) TaxID=167879 RepID=Q489H0_COLP3|nr:RluA family pseudouridine synthase [Colwellia psychrerythraea]AAZ26284.1 RNA pseudouridine synthase family protein [Colwellia psychrerythraea 34H]
MSNTSISTYLSSFVSDISHYSLPDSFPGKFTYPFCYKAHPLALAASEELQQKLEKFHPVESEQQGRMYGVLIVKDTQGSLGYLAALSGNANESNTDKSNIDNDASINFVPTIHQAYNQSEFEKQQQVEINGINKKINLLAANPEIDRLTVLLETETAKSDEEIQSLQQQMRDNKKARKDQRTWLSTTVLPEDEHRDISIALSRASVTDKKALQALKLQHQTKINLTSSNLQQLTNEIESLKNLRKKLSSTLQKHFFKQYQMLNSKGERKDLIKIFADTLLQKPPAGSGDCAAPKLLQYAFEHKLTPLCMAEFWWGKQPKSEIRKHKHFYPACQGKCLPILGHMLEGMEVDKNPLLINPAEGIDLEIVFQDEHVVVVNKPAGLLSVPGKSIKDSVYTRIKTQFPQASGGLIVHRLDMATSGLLMLALNERAHKHLQQQFMNKEINKRYVATIEGKLEKTSGEICLPLRGDFDDRPKQMVCHEHGKYAETHWQLIEEVDNTSKLFLYPITGRTHQLRMHCAHPDGLNLPIIGDSLYGHSADRLHLHAQRLSFTHPITKELLTFEVAENF